MHLPTVLFAAGLSLAVVPAAATPEPRGVTVAFGNTVKAQYADGKFQRLWFKADANVAATQMENKADTMESAGAPDATTDAMDNKADATRDAADAKGDAIEKEAGKKD